MGEYATKLYFKEYVDCLETQISFLLCHHILKASTRHVFVRRYPSQTEFKNDQNIPYEI